LYDRLGTLTGHFKDLGAGLDGAVKSYNQAIASLGSRVIVTARKMKELGAAGAKEIPELSQVEREPSQLT
jgi:DNA recombination protein RmuC